MNYYVKRRQTWYFIESAMTKFVQNSTEKHSGFTFIKFNVSVFIEICLFFTLFCDKEVDKDMTPVCKGSTSFCLGCLLVVE